jgi:hypothetical protein
MEPAGSLRCSKESSTSPYPELDQSSPYFYPSMIQFNIMNPPTSWSS